MLLFSIERLEFISKTTFLVPKRLVIPILNNMYLTCQPQNVAQPLPNLPKTLPRPKRPQHPPLRKRPPCLHRRPRRPSRLPRPNSRSRIRKARHRSPCRRSTRTRLRIPRLHHRYREMLETCGRTDAWLLLRSRNRHGRCL